MPQICVIWDMDGTLIDSKELHYLTWQMALKKISLDLDRKVFDEHFGKSNLISLPLYLGFQPDATLFQELLTFKEVSFQNQAPSKTHLFPGVSDWLDYFKKNNFKQALASSAPMSNIQFLINQFEISGFFNTVLAGPDYPSKPAPDIFLKAAELLEAEPHNCVVIEDSHVGVDGAKRAGMHSIAVANTHAADTLNADLVILDFSFSPVKAMEMLFNQLP